MNLLGASEKVILDGSVAVKTRDQAGADKTVKKLIQKHGKELPKEFGNVKEPADAIEEKIKKQGGKLKLPKPEG